MLPIIWRFLLNQYLKATALCVAALVIVLLITRLSDIAHFATLDASFVIVLFFILYQIPYILPIAIPVGCLISSVFLVQRLSKTHELTALRACGMSLKNFITPLLIASAALSLLSFYLTSELATTSHLNTSLWKEELRSVNPLFLLKNKHLMKLKGAYFDSLGPSKTGESAELIVMALPDKTHQRINLLLAEKIKAKEDKLFSKRVALIKTAAGKNEEGFDQLVIENIGESKVLASDFTKMLQEKTLNINNDHLKMSLLLSRIHHEKEKLKAEPSKSDIKEIRKNINRGYSEIFRRLSASVSVFTFTLMGLSFGITISRNSSNKGLFILIAAAALYLASYFSAKGIDHRPVISILMYLVPHAIMIALAVWMLNRISKGQEAK